MQALNPAPAPDAMRPVGIHPAGISFILSQQFLAGKKAF